MNTILPVTTAMYRCYFKSLALFGFGLLAWLLTTGMTIQSNRAAASTEIGAALFCGSAAFVDAMVVLLASGVGVLLAHRLRLAAAGILVALMCFSAYSMVSVVGFVALQRIAAFATVSHNNDASELAGKDRNRRALGDRDDAIAFLREQITPEIDRSKRKLLLTSLQKLVAQPVPLEMWKTEPVVIDPDDEVLKMLADKLNLGIRDVLIGKTLALAILLVLGKALCFALGGALWPAATVTYETAATVTGETVSDPDASVAPLAFTTAWAMDPFDATDTSPLTRSVDGSTTASETAATKKPSDARSIVGEFLRQARAVSQSSEISNAKAETVYHWYRTWAIAHDYDPVPTLTQFGRFAGELLSEIGICRQRTGRFVFYYGVAAPIATVAPRSVVNLDSRTRPSVKPDSIARLSKRKSPLDFPKQYPAPARNVVSSLQQKTVASMGRRAAETFTGVNDRPRAETTISPLI